MSAFKKINDNSLKLILEQVQEKFDDEGLDVEKMSDIMEHSNLIEDVTKYFGANDLSFEDLSYLCEVFSLNSDFDPPLRRPFKKKKIRVTHKEYFTQSGVKYYEQYINSYTLLDKEDISVMGNEGMYEWWDGNLVDEDFGEYYTDDDSIDDVAWVE